MNSNQIRAELQKASRFRGIYTRVARKLNVSPNHVKEVAMGRRSSNRVERAIEREYRRIVEAEKAA